MIKLVYCAMCAGVDRPPHGSLCDIERRGEVEVEILPLPSLQSLMASDEAFERLLWTYNL